MCKKKKFRHLLYTINTNSDINSKWIGDINVRMKTTQLLEETIGVSFYDLELSKALLDKTSKA